MNKAFNEKKICRCCKKDSLSLYLPLGNQPLANSYHKGEKLPLFPLNVNVCKSCFHSQLSIVVNPDTMFRNYLYVSGTTKTFREHTKKLARNAVRRFKKNNLTVLDIACNDGTQLEYFRELGCKVYGIDPAENLRPITRGKKINVKVAYWKEDMALAFENKIDIMTGTNVFAHVDDLDEFLRASRIALKREGLLILEFPYADKMIAHNEFDTVYHEHLSYFTVNSFSTLATRMGFHIVDVLQTNIHGGSIRFFLKKGENVHIEKINLLIEHERINELLTYSTYKKFAKRVVKNKKDLRKLFTTLTKEKKKIIGYGASAKGNTMLNYFKIKPSYIVDDNSLKWGYLTPGMDIPIKDPNELAVEKKKLYIIVLSWNFYNEIVKKIVSLRGDRKGDICILYVPSVRKIPVATTYSFINSA